MSWNCVLNYVIKIKNSYIKLYGEDNLYDYYKNGYDNCINYWLDNLNNNSLLNYDLYKDISNNVTFLQNNNYVLVRYNDLGIDWNKYNNFYFECRSVVIDIKNECLVLTPFRKFRNLNECEENSIENISNRIANAKNIEISDKLDGSMVSIRYYNDEIVISGSKSINPKNSWRLENYYNYIDNNDNIQKLIKAYPTVTFIFEGIFKEDAHVVKYDSEMYGLHLIGARDVNTGKEFSYLDISTLGNLYDINHVSPLNKTFNQIVEEASSGIISSDKAEGYVVNIDGYKIKVKHTDYVLMHKALGKIVSPNYIIDAIKNNKYDDWYAKTPDAYKPQVEEVYNNVIKYINKNNDIINYYYELIPRENRKDCMIWIENNVPDIYKGKVRSKYLGKEIDHFKKMRYDNVKQYLEGE